MGLKNFFQKLFSFNKKKKILSNCKLEKALANPIIRPKQGNSWESWQTFNPAAIYLNNQVHFLYRAIGGGNLSVLGYANSKNGISIEERSNKLAYKIKQEYFAKEKTNLNYCSGGSVAGCEDPRLVEIDNIVYLLHTTFSNWSQVRITLSWINKQDFLEKKWNKWSRPVFVSPPNQIHKNWVLFPEKINGKFALLHSLSPKILVDYFDSLDFNKQNFVNSHYHPRETQDWESYIRGVGPPPIKTKQGWLVFYHGVDKKDGGKYKLGAMLLDLNNPEKILFKAKEPVLEPETIYEESGFKPGVVYSCGAVVIKGKLFVYYGGADSVACVATAGLNEFIKKLKETKKPKFKKTSWLKILKNVFSKKI